MEEDLERDTSEEQQGGDEEDEAGRVFSKDHHAEQPNQLEKQQQRGKVYGQCQEQASALFRFLILPDCSKSRCQFTDRFGDLRWLCRLQLFRMNVAQQRLLKAFVQEVESCGD